MIDWGAAEIVQEAAVRNSFASCELRKNYNYESRSNFGFPACVEINAFTQKAKPHVCNCSSW